MSKMQRKLQRQKRRDVESKRKSERRELAKADKPLPDIDKSPKPLPDIDKSPLSLQKFLLSNDRPHFFWRERDGERRKFIAVSLSKYPQTVQNEIISLIETEDDPVLMG